jgi:hypothetical protein
LLSLSLSLSLISEDKKLKRRRRGGPGGRAGRPLQQASTGRKEGRKEAVALGFGWLLALKMNE